ncbi:c-type cytochrome [Ohtaekwangia kribbensis]|jgi:cytochrome c6|uniref:C-type cytochrome n=1 Tax=Ohtaekwangia kribbensis TaxID=688913 RepID=A0ABW3K0Z5_9BACT
MAPRTFPLIATLIVCLTAAAFRSTDHASSDGQLLYEQHCMRCHGKDGTKGFLGAKNLQLSALTDAAIIQQILKGKGFMPPFRKKLTANEISEVMLYIKSLRVKE